MMGRAISIVKRLISIAIGIGLVIASQRVFDALYEGGMSMVNLESQAGNTVAEYYYQAMGTCMTGFAYFAVAVLWALAWIIAVWPDNQEVIAAITRNDSNRLENQTAPRPDEARQ
jgi:hypothetical protein